MGFLTGFFWNFLQFFTAGGAAALQPEAGGGSGPSKNVAFPVVKTPIILLFDPKNIR